jgi:hypothetical protein
MLRKHRFRIGIRGALSAAVLSVLVLTTSAAAATSVSPTLKRIYIEVTRPDLAPYLRFDFTKRVPSCVTPNPSKVKISLRSGSIAYDLAAKWCRDSQGDLRWRTEGQHGVFLQVNPWSPTVELMPQVFRTRVFGYSVVVDGQLVRKGRVWVKIDNYGQRTMWKDVGRLRGRMH